MLSVIVPPAPATEMWDEDACEFVQIPAFKGATLRLEHSLISIRRWESKWHKSYTSTREKTADEMIDYIRCMTLKEVDPDTYNHLTAENLKEIVNYINDPATATTIRKRPGKGPSRKIVTAEVIESWMIDAEVPFDPFEKLHLNHLLTLLEVRNEQASPGRKISKKNIMKDNAALNASRKAKMRTRG